jgi:membrane-associated phospholipid phosphatase
VSRFLICLALGASTARSVVAQSALGSERRDIGDLRGDVWAVWTSPAHADHRAIVPLAAVSGAVIATGFADSAIYAWMTTHPNSLVMKTLRPMREHWKLPLYDLGSGQILLPLAAGAYVAGRLSHDAALRDAGLGCIAGHLSSAVIRDVIYLTISRVRPHETPKPDRISIPGTRDWMRHSFLSGHVANSMACASFLAHRYSLGAVEPAAYAYVTMIGLGRMADGWHWASDTMAGAAVGFAIGKYIAERQEKRASARSNAAAAAPIRIGWSIAF